MMTTEQIRFDFARGFANGEDDIRLREWRFDQWLTEHDRQTAEKAWDQGWAEGNDVTERAYLGDTTANVPDSRDNNPYRRKDNQ